MPFNPGGGGGTGITGNLISSFVPVATGTHTVADSVIAQNGARVSINPLDGGKSANLEVAVDTGTANSVLELRDTLDLRLNITASANEDDHSGHYNVTATGTNANIDLTSDALMNLGADSMTVSVNQAYDITATSFDWEARADSQLLVDGNLTVEATGAAHDAVLRSEQASVTVEGAGVGITSDTGDVAVSSAGGFSVLSTGDNVLNGNTGQFNGNTTVAVNAFGGDASITATGNVVANGVDVDGVLYQSFVQVATPNDTSEDTIATIIVPAGTLRDNGGFVVKPAFSSSALVGALTVRIYFGGTLLATTTEAIGAVFVMPVLTVGNRGATNSQVSFGYTVKAGQQSLIALATSAIDTTTDQDIVITTQKATGTDTVNMESLIVRLTPMA